MRRPRPQRGAVTAELALGLPLLLGVTAGLVWLLAVGAGQLRTVDAARETARAIARGDSTAEAVAVGRRVAPPGASVQVVDGGGTVTVVVRATVAGPGGLLDSLPAAHLRAEATALTEDTS